MLTHTKTVTSRMGQNRHQASRDSRRKGLLQQDSASKAAQLCRKQALQALHALPAWTCNFASVAATSSAAAASMNRLDRAKKDKISQFKAITDTVDKTALQCLQAGSWSIEAGIEYYYANMAAMLEAHAQTTSQEGVAAMFNRYKDEHADMILADGMGRFCNDLQVDPEDLVMLVIAWHCGAATMCEFSREEFARGMHSLRCDSPEKLRRKLPELRRELQDERKFKEIYVFAYGFSLEKGVKCMQQEVAVAMWRLIFSVQPWPLLDAWCDFLEQHHNRAISKDTWMQLLDFSRAVKEDLTNFEDSGSAWPYLIDDFVDHMRAGKLLAT